MVAVFAIGRIRLFPARIPDAGRDDARLTADEVLHDPKNIHRQGQRVLRSLLDFFQIHDPTTKNRRGNERGAGYRSAIYYTNDDHKVAAEDIIADIEASGLWPGKVVTEVEPVGEFWEAEPGHEDYLERIPNGHSCHFVRPNWKLRHRAAAV